MLHFDPLRFLQTFQDYKASEGWELSYIIGGTADQALEFGTEVVASGDDFIITIPATTTNGWAVGEYWYRGQAKNSGEVYTVSEGTFSVLNVSSQYEEIAHTKKVLDAINAVLENRATKDQESYTIKGRSLSRTPMADLLTLKSTYQTKYAQLKRAERISKGQKGSKVIYTRFIR